MVGSGMPVPRHCCCLAAVTIYNEMGRMLVCLLTYRPRLGKRKRRHYAGHQLHGQPIYQCRQLLSQENSRPSRVEVFWVGISLELCLPKTVGLRSLGSLRNTDEEEEEEITCIGFRCS